MKNIKSFPVTAVCALAVTLVAGCANLPGTNEEQGVVIGGVTGAAAGAAVAGSGHRTLGALLGGIIGAGSGYMIGARRDRIQGTPEDQQAAQAAISRAQADPATVADVHTSTTADLNKDGFVTADEVIAMSDAGLRDDEIVTRLRATGQVFELTSTERQHLLNNGVPLEVVEEMNTINIA
ncbi:MAG: glycine zipper domain-containing protein [Gammaproteobacteria bacterium]